MKKVLFICTGNYYRSRFAEHYFNHKARQLKLNWQANSKGFKADNPENKGPVSIFCISALKQRHIEFTELNRYPQRVCEEDLKASDIIIALKKSEHEQFVTKDFPKWSNKFEYWFIHDIDVELPETALLTLEKEVDKLISRLNQEV